MLKKIAICGACLLAIAGFGTVSVFAAADGALSYNIGPSFSVGAGVGFSMREVHDIADSSITDRLDASRFLVKADIAPVKYVDIYGLIGAGEMQLDSHRYEGGLGLDWGVGIRPQLFPLVWHSPLNITLDAQYLETRDVDHKRLGRMGEVQASLIFSYVMKSLAPYGGVKYDHATALLSEKKADVVDNLDWGIFLGCDYFVTQNVFFNVEVSIFSETAFFLSTGYKY
jgi:hypothetical protein